MKRKFNVGDVIDYLGSRYSITASFKKGGIYYQPVYDLSSLLPDKTGDFKTYRKVPQSLIKC